MMDKRKIYKKLMVIGRATGCHQLPERSFSFRGKQFPVCARCTGVFIGEVLGIFLFKVGEISNIIAVVFSLIMFADWFTGIGRAVSRTGESESGGDHEERPDDP